MFASLSDNISKVFDKLRGKGVLNEEDVNLAMREVRIALLEADVSLPVVKDFINQVKEKAIGEEVIKSISPAQMVIKIVQDELTKTLGSEASELNLKAIPSVIMMIGLQGSGKTTSSGKLANWLKTKQGKKILLASLDIYRPAAQKQLEVLAKQIGVESIEIIDGQKPKQITERALKEAKLGGYDVLILDTAGRLQIDSDLMEELKVVKSISNPQEVLLVADSLTGQEAVNIADQFNKEIGISGLILTRIDGDGRGGAALSMKAVTGQPIKFIGQGEKISDFDIFYPERIAGRILDKGDIISLVELAQENINQEEAAEMFTKMKSGSFDFNDLAKQIKTISKLGGMSSLMGYIPGLGKFKDKINEANIDGSVFKKQLAIIGSMTKRERIFPKLLNASRKIRIAKGAGVSVQEINQLVKMQKQMETMMKKMGKMPKKSFMNPQAMQMMNRFKP
jgi:signal recognition particle subunit SRP54